MSFYELKEQAFPGQLRARSYQYIPLPNPDAIWFPRFQQYWTNQERLYGLEFYPDMKVAYDDEAGTVTSFAVVRRVLDGYRVPKPATPGASILAMH